MVIKVSNLDIWVKLWEKSYLNSQRSKIIDAVCERGDSQALQWFWEKSYLNFQRSKIQEAMLNLTIKKQPDDEPILPKKNGQKNVEKQYDVFICHASEDKKDFVSSLASRLVESGLNVWYDSFTLKLGDNLRRCIDQGLLNTRFGIVVLSPSFFRKEWPQKELDGLVTLESDGKKVILPIWHNVSYRDVAKYSPKLANRVGVKTSRGLDVVIKEILDVING